MQYNTIQQNKIQYNKPFGFEIIAWIIDKKTSHLILPILLRILQFI